MIAAGVSAVVLGGCSDNVAPTQVRPDASTATDGAADATKGGEPDVSGDVAVPPEPLRLFYTNFEGSVPPQVNLGDCKLKPTQGYATLGAPNNVFADTFLWCPVQKKVVVTLPFLAPHTSIDIAFLLAAIDSLDGTSSDGTGDFFSVSLDGHMVFRQSFANAVFIEAATNMVTNVVQGYVPPPGVELARRKELGFTQGPYWLDSAYDMGLEPASARIPHSSSTATIVFTLSNDRISSFDDDESWALDNLRITVGDAPRAASDAGAHALFDSAAVDAR